MSKNSVDVTSAIMASDQCIWRLEGQSCDQCEDVCYSIEGRATGIVGGQVWDTPIAWITHVDQATALSVTARAIGRNADKVRNRQLAADLLERQASLW